MEFGMIFLCLLIGCVIGFEIGKYVTAKRMKDAINQMIDGLKKAADEHRIKQRENYQKENTDE